MKRHLILAAAALLCLTACAQNNKKMNENKTLIAWFSWSGNTEAVVNHIAEVTGADTFRIEREKPYPAEYDPCTVDAKNEVDNHVFPACDKSLDENQEEGFNGKSIVVYFSNPLPGVDAVAGASITIKDGQKYGSVQYMAEVIKEKTDSDIHRITVEENHYPTVYRELADFANAEKADNARPKLSSTLTNLDDYDVIFLGTPIWWYTLPMPVFSFLDQYDLSGKKVIPFTAHEGSGLGGAPATIKAEEPHAAVESNGFSARGTQTSSQDDAIKSWLKSLGF